MKRRWEVWLGGEVRGRTFGARDSIESRRNLSRRRLNPSGNHWCRSRERWQVRVKIGGRRHHVGITDTAEQAEQLWCEWWPTVGVKLWEEAYGEPFYPAVEAS